MLDYSRLDALRADRVRGATALTHDLCDELLGTVRALQWDADPAASTQTMRELCERVALLRPTFGAPAHIAFVCRALLSRSEPGQRGPLVLRYLTLVESQLTEAPERLAARAAPLLPIGGMVATLSAGASVRATLLAAHALGRRPRVYAAESRPRGEGVGQAAELAAAGLDVRVVPDAALPGLLEEGATGLLGADRLLEDAVIAKCGAYPLALSLARVRRPLIVLADTTKILPRVMAPVAHELDDARLLIGDAAVAADALVFEEVPMRLIARIVTERGVWPRAAVKRFALQMPGRLKRGEWRAFGLETPRPDNTRGDIRADTSVDTSADTSQDTGAATPVLS